MAYSVSKDLDTNRPKENPGRRLTSQTVVWVHVPFVENGNIVPGRTKTPVFVAGVKRDGTGNLLSISAFYTCIAEGREFDDPLRFKITDKAQKRNMGVGEQDRATDLRRPKTIPFMKAFFGDVPEITGNVPDRLWNIFGRRVRTANEERVANKFSRNQIWDWSNVPG